MELIEAIKSRRTIRKYQDREVPVELVKKAIELACWAPNTGGFQSWKYYVVTDSDVINRMGDAVQKKVDLIASWPEAETFAEAMARQQEKCAFFRTAPVIVAMGMSNAVGPAEKVLRLRGEQDRDAAEMTENRALISGRGQTIGAAATLLSLALYNLGLSSCWLAGPMLARREIEQLLDVPGDEALFAILPIGYPAEAPEPKARKPLDEVVRVI
jgi:nitroreductase